MKQKQYVTLETASNFLSDNADKIESLKVTQFNRYGFNEIEGSQYEINLKVVTSEKYKNKLIHIATNQTWLDDLAENGHEGDDLETIVFTYFKAMVWGWD